MRFISMHKVNEEMEAGVPPSQELMAGMGALIGEMAGAGVFVAGEGLQPSSTRVRLQFAGGRTVVTRGPLTGSNELVAGLLLVQVKSLDEALEWATRYARAVGAEEVEVGPLNEPWDLGLCPPPTGDVPRRYLLLRKADQRAEGGAPRDPQRLAALTAEMKAANVLLLAEELEPSSKGIRLKASRGKRSVLDGPFTESKELIAGFAMLRVASLEEARYWAERFVDVFGDVELDVLQVADGVSPRGS